MFVPMPMALPTGSPTVNSLMPPIRGWQFAVLDGQHEVSIRHPLRGVSIGERCERSVVSDQYDGLGFPRCFVAAHARRIRRHSGHGNTDGVRLLLKQGNKRSNGYMALYDVALDQSCVT